MDQFQVNKATYLIQRVFVGTKTSADLVAERLKESSHQVLPLTTSSPAQYNTDGSQLVRSSE